MTFKNNSLQSRMATLPSAAEGVVVNTNDPQQEGRVQVWCPGIDAENTEYDNLPWAKVVSPLAGQLNNYPAGSRGEVTKGLTSYGFWAVPPLNSLVDVVFLYNNPNQRRVIGSVFGNHGNRSLPVGRNRPDIGAKAPVSDSLEPIQPQTRNLTAQFNGNLDASEARTRGAYERQAAQDKDVRDGSEGYQKNPYEYGRDLSPQTISLTTPGRHSLIFQDHPETGRIRIKTADGHQIIFDDANERIYLSTCSGKTWVELDRDGHMHFYGAESVSIGAGGDINLTAKGNINMAAGKNINLTATESILGIGCKNLSMAGGTVFFESKSQMNLLASGNIIETGSNIHLNGPTADSSICPEIPVIVPDHEPWSRPATKATRGPNWKA